MSNQIGPFWGVSHSRPAFSGGPTHPTPHPDLTGPEEGDSNYKILHDAYLPKALCAADERSQPAFLHGSPAMELLPHLASPTTRPCPPTPRPLDDPSIFPTNFLNKRRHFYRFYPGQPTSL